MRPRFPFRFWALKRTPTPDLSTEEGLVALLQALQRYGFKIEDVPRRELWEKLRELEFTQRSH